MDKALEASALRKQGYTLPRGSAESVAAHVTADLIQADIAKDNAEEYERLLLNPNLSAEDRERFEQRVRLWRSRESYRRGMGPNPNARTP